MMQEKRTWCKQLLHILLLEIIAHIRTKRISYEGCKECIFKRSWEQSVILPDSADFSQEARNSSFNWTSHSMLEHFKGCFNSHTSYHRLKTHIRIKESKLIFEFKHSSTNAGLIYKEYLWSNKSHLFENGMKLPDSSRVSNNTLERRHHTKTWDGSRPLFSPSQPPINSSLWRTSEDQSSLCSCITW